MANKINRKADDKKILYLLILVVIVLVVAVAYLTLVKPVEAPVVTSDKKATEVQQDLSTSVSDIKDDLEQLKKSLGK
ncbi:MAG: hypothetical protein HY361_04615 [Candidatus Aenigmarchaeota archaeon]|nr:hypothetical protein [Candidatus Aenigmarchaeota archaeon]